MSSHEHPHHHHDQHHRTHHHHESHEGQSSHPGAGRPTSLDAAHQTLPGAAAHPADTRPEVDSTPRPASGYDNGLSGYERILLHHPNQARTREDKDLLRNLQNGYRQYDEQMTRATKPFPR